MSFNQQNFNPQGGGSQNNANQFSLALLHAMIQQQQQQQHQQQQHMISSDSRPVNPMNVDNRPVNLMNVALPLPIQGDRMLTIGGGALTNQQPIISFSSNPRSAPPEINVPSDSQSQSTYRDFSGVPADNTDEESRKWSSKGNKRVSKKFPIKLFDMLSRDEFSNVIAWAPHGRSWRVLKPKAFESEVLPQYFTHGKYNSFMRQVNGWGFRRISQGPDFNSYYHEYFLRGMCHLCSRMRRTAITRSSGETYYDPDFRNMRPLPVPSPGTKSQALNLAGSLGGEGEESGEEFEVHKEKEDKKRTPHHEDTVSSATMDQNTAPHVVSEVHAGSLNSFARLIGGGEGQASNLNKTTFQETKEFNVLAGLFGNNGIFSGGLIENVGQQFQQLRTNYDRQKPFGQDQLPCDVPSRVMPIQNNSLSSTSSGSTQVVPNTQGHVTLAQLGPMAEYLAILQQQQQPVSQNLSQQNRQGASDLSANINAQLSAFLKANNYNNTR